VNSMKTKRPKFRLGDWVTFDFGAKPAFAQIIEDRGPLGVNRRRLFRIRLDQESNEPFLFEMPEEEMEKAVPDKTAVLQYLKQGGLVNILGSNLQGGPKQNQPRAWLTFGPRGNIAHTFEAGRGIVGDGSTVPSWALHENKIFFPKKQDVITYLGSFGLTREEAEDVVAAVGMAPDPIEIRQLNP
jgi:hypothetical protein